MLLRYNMDTDGFELKGLTISDISSIASALHLAGNYGKPHKDLAKKLDAALEGMEARVKNMEAENNESAI